MSDPIVTPPPAAPAEPTLSAALVEVAAEYVAAHSHSDTVVDQWFLETFHNRGLGTDEFNRLNAARDELKRRLR